MKEETEKFNEKTKVVYKVEGNNYGLKKKTVMILGMAFITMFILISLSFLGLLLMKV